MITFLILWALAGHAYWLRYELDVETFAGDGPIVDLCAMVAVWIGGPFSWLNDL